MQQFIQRSRVIRFASIILASVFLSGCALMPMQLTHSNQIHEKFANLGTVTIKQFIDYRPQAERDVVVRDKNNTNYPIILSGNSQPSAVQYLQNVIEHEAQRTGIFVSTTQNPQFVMTGIIYSMIAGVTNNPVVETHESESLMQPTNQIYDFARVRLLVVLKQNDKVVFRKTITIDESKPITKPNAVEVQASLLDMATTKAIRAVFSEMEYRLKH